MVVTEDVPAHAVVGVPARVIRCKEGREPAEMAA